MNKLQVIALFLVLVCPSFAFGEEGWRQLETEYTNILYRSDSDLEIFERKLKVGRPAGLFGIWSLSSTDVIPRLKEKIDRIFKSNQKLLQMYNIKNKINVKVYRTQSEINHVHRYIVSRYKIRLSSHHKHIAFYFHRQKTVYLSLEEVTEGVAAHELGHAIINHYFIITPPYVVGEILSQYVDKHLERF